MEVYYIYLSEESPSLQLSFEQLSLISISHTFIYLHVRTHRPINRACTCIYQRYSINLLEDIGPSATLRYYIGNDLTFDLSHVNKPNRLKSSLILNFFKLLVLAFLSFAYYT